MGFGLTHRNNERARNIRIEGRQNSSVCCRDLGQVAIRCLTAGIHPIWKPCNVVIIENEREGGSFDLFKSSKQFASCGE
jgi:hypothetical protein